MPADAYYGVQTARALENFQLSGIAINHYPGFVEAWAIVKLAAARANTDVGAMKKERLAAIEKACEAVLDGKYHDQFLVDWYQGGAGTSTNMNANEVLANIGLELTGHKKGEYQFLEPHDDLNMSQSTNDSYPTAIKVALILRNDKLIGELQKLVASFRAKGNEYLRIVKMGRTELQDAVPMTVGPGVPRVRGLARGRDPAAPRRREVPVRGQHGRDRDRHGDQRPERAIPRSAPRTWRSSLKKPIVPSSDMIAATWDQQGFVVYSSALKSVAIKLAKISSDLILLASGPRAGLAEINLPALQPGSSIMPGKVNPVVPEVIGIVAYRVMANDYAVTLAAHSGQLQLNAYEPLDGLRVHRVPAPPVQRVDAPPHQVRRRHHGEREGARALHGDHGRHRHRAQPGPRLRQGHRAGQRGLQERQGDPRGHPREEGPDRSADQGPARSDQADQSRSELSTTRSNEGTAPGKPDEKRDSP